MPMPGAYWLAPDSSAASAASITDAGPSASGNPWPRLIAPVRTASADISLKTVGGMWARRRDRADALMASNIARRVPGGGRGAGCGRSGRAGQPGVAQVEVRRLADRQRVELGH